jgi:two-component system chemotaxis response regulator CheB
MEKNILKHTYEMLIIGGSAGSLDALLEMLPKLSQSISFTILIILHRKSTVDLILPHLLASKTNLPVKEVEDKEVIQKSVIYVAPPDYHVLIEKNRQFALDYSEKVNYSRPSIDVTFESAAYAYGPELICIVLSGANNDGTLGALKIKENGGYVVAQQPETAIVPFMPASVIQHVQNTLALTIPELTDLVNSL